MYWIGLRTHGPRLPITGLVRQDYRDGFSVEASIMLSDRQINRFLRDGAE